MNGFQGFVSSISHRSFHQQNFKNFIINDMRAVRENVPIDRIENDFLSSYDRPTVKM